MVSPKRVSATADSLASPYPGKEHYLFIIVAILIAVSPFWLSIWSAIPSGSDNKFSTLLSIGNALIAICGVFFAVHSFRASARNTRDQQKKQHTITILFESRLSPELRDANETRKSVFPLGTDISYEDWRAAYEKRAGDTAIGKDALEARYKAAEALVTLLNYFEFLSLRMKLEDLDAELLRGSIRGIMCNLVDDARFVIAHLQKNNKKSYEHLSELYDEWRDPTATDTRGNLSERPIPKL